jgi:flagellar basal body-associated protein FliL
MGNKKTLLILLIALALILAASGWYFFTVLKPSQPTNNSPLNSSYEEIYKAKEVTIENIINFLKTKRLPINLWQSFSESVQYRSLQEFKVEIDIKKGIGNPEPFVPLEARKK